MLLISALMLCSLEALSQRFSVGSNVADLLSLGTMEMEASASVLRHVTVHAGTELNPWIYRSSEPSRQLQQKQFSVWAGARWWPWHVYSGWWAGADARYSVYNGGGVIRRQTEEGDAWGAGLYGGYGVMLDENWNLDLGAGVWGGWKEYVVYSCPRCGVTVDKGGKTFILPDVRIAIQWIF